MEEKNRNNLDKIKPEYIQEVNLTLIQYTSAFTQKLIKIQTITQILRLKYASNSSMMYIYG